MSVTITGSKTRVVNEVQSRLDKFAKCTKAYEQARKALYELGAKNVELANSPSHEDRYNTLLSEYKKAAEELKAAAVRIEKKTDPKHIEKYFKPRQGFLIYRYIHGQHKAHLLGIHEQAEEIIKIDFDAQVIQLRNESQRRVREAQGTIEFSQIDQTFPICRDRLLAENPSEYLRQSALYQDKLLEKKDGTAALAFGMSWINHLPKETTWEQVEIMSFAMIEATAHSDSADLTEFRMAVEKWLKEHPASESSDLTPSIPAPETTIEDRQTYVLGRLLTRSQTLDLSPEAFKLYQDCASIDPDQLDWKILQAHYHISKRQWKEAEQALADLPKDNPAVIHVQSCLATRRLDWDVDQVFKHISEFEWNKAEQVLVGLPQNDPQVIEARKSFADQKLERMCSAGLDLGFIAVSRLTPVSFRSSIYFDAFQTSFQVSSTPSIRRTWMPKLLGTYNPSTPPLTLGNKLITGALVVGDVSDFVFRHLPIPKGVQQVENLMSLGLRITYTLTSVFQAPSQPWLPVANNVAGSCISSFQAYDELRGNRRSASFQASLSTAQQAVSDLSPLFAIYHYRDAMSVVGSYLYGMTRYLSVNRLIDRVSSNPSQENSEDSKVKWVLVGVGGTFLTYRAYNYPYVWAARVMQNAENLYSQGKYEDAASVLTQSETSWFVSRGRPAVEAYTKHGGWLKEYPTCLEDPTTYKAFITDLNHALATLAAVSYYKDTRDNLCFRRIETTIRGHDPEGLKESLEENPPDQIVVLGFNFLLKHSYHLAIEDTGAPEFLKMMGACFPARFQPQVNQLVTLLKTHAASIQDWKQTLYDLTQKPPSEETVRVWNEALKALQNFFYEHGGEAGVYQDLQVKKLLTSFSQNDSLQIDALFKESDIEVHQQFTHILILSAHFLWKKGKHQEAIDLLKKAKFSSFKEEQLVRDFEHFLSLLQSKPQDTNTLDRVLSKLLVSLVIKDASYNEFREFLLTWRVVVNLEPGRHFRAKALLSREKTESKIPGEVAFCQFEKIYTLAQADETKAKSELKIMIDKLENWQHSELFSAYYAFLSCGPSLNDRIAHLTTIIKQLNRIGQSSNITSNLKLLQHQLRFDQCLAEAKFVEAKNFLTATIPQELHSELCNSLIDFVIYQGDQLRRSEGLNIARQKTAQILDVFSSLPISHVIHSYLNFLTQVENIQGNIIVHQKAYHALNTVCEQLASLNYETPPMLLTERTNILLNTGFLAMHSNQLARALAIFVAVQRSGVESEQLSHYINILKQQLSVKST